MKLGYKRNNWEENFNKQDLRAKQDHKVSTIDWEQQEQLKAPFVEALTQGQWVSDFDLEDECRVSHITQEAIENKGYTQARTKTRVHS